MYESFHNIRIFLLIVGGLSQMFLPEVTMNGLAVEDSMTANGNLHSRVLRVILSSKLNDLQPSLSQIVSETVDLQVSTADESSNGWRKLQVFSMAKSVIAAANSLVFFGEDLSRKDDFVQAALDYPEDLLRTAEILRLLPSAIRSYVAPALMGQHKASTILVKYLIPAVEERQRQKAAEEITPNPPLDCIQFFVDASFQKDAWPAQKIVQVILGIWFASVHQPALSLIYALDDLCTFPDHAECLTQIIEQCLSHEDLDSLPLLDSFLKESARVHPSDSISVRRKVLEPYMFADGTTLLKGDVACVPLQAIMRDPALYPQSLQFDPYRFIGKSGSGDSARFTDATATYPLWGLGKRAW